MTIQSVRKALVGKKDVNFDLDGSGSQFSKITSKGGFRSDFLVNASHIPVTTTVRAKKYADQVTVTTKTDFDVDAVLEQILGNLENIGVPSASFFDVAGVGGALTIIANAITATQLNTDSVTTDKINADAVVSSKIADGAIDTAAQIADNLINSQHYAALSIDNEHLAVDVVGIEEQNMDNAGNSFRSFTIATGKTAASPGGVSTIAVSPSFDVSELSVATDNVHVTFQVNAGAVRIDSALVTSTTAFTITFSANLTAGDIVQYDITRATTAVS